MAYYSLPTSSGFCPVLKGRKKNLCYLKRYLFVQSCFFRIRVLVLLYFCPRACTVSLFFFSLYRQLVLRGKQISADMWYDSRSFLVFMLVHVFLWYRARLSLFRPVMLFGGLCKNFYFSFRQFGSQCVSFYFRFRQFRGQCG